ncbi:MAG: hypothetical protein EOO38_09240 [Cytophagaceae bacterium]|nr:MAG: hypothetical protein EOO38_09240 [Cytophagaceae bacterium]
MQNTREQLCDMATVRMAHAVAKRLKEVRPALRSQVDELQGRVTRAHRQLQELDQLLEEATQLCEHDGRKLQCDRAHDYEMALNDLNTAYQSLRDLLHSTKAPMPTSPLLMSASPSLPSVMSSASSTSDTRVDSTSVSRKR